MSSSVRRHGVLGLPVKLSPQKSAMQDKDPRSLDDFIIASSVSITTSPCSRLRYWLIFLSLGVGNASDASEILCMSYILSLNDFQTDILKSHGAGLLAAAVFAGMLIGGLLVGTLGDYRGRRPMLLWGLAINCIAGILSACSIHLYLLCSIRFVAGIGIGATVPPLFTLCSELPTPVDRGFWVTVIASFWMIGSIYVAIVGWLLLEWFGASWRTFVVMCAVPSALGWIMTFRFVPESPKFLLLQGRYDRAAATANYLAECLASLTDPISETELRESEIREQQRAETVNDTVSLPVRGFIAAPPVQQSVFEFLVSTRNDFIESTAQLYKTSVQLKHTTIVLQVIWFSISFGSYGLLTWINTLFVELHLENVYRNALLFALANLPGNILSAILMDRIGRTSLFIGCILAAGSSLLVFALFANRSSKHEAQIIVIAACLFQCFSITAWNSVDVLTSELFPTVIRASGMGICAASGRIGAMLAQFINGALVKQPVSLLMVAAGTLMLGAVAALFLPADKTGQPVSDRIAEPIRRNVTLGRPQTKQQYDYQEILRQDEPNNI
jgi:MFS family permease